MGLVEAPDWSRTVPGKLTGGEDAATKPRLPGKIVRHPVRE